MKQLTNFSDHDQNWHWPEKTWFRERLNALKARENEERRKAPMYSTRPDRVTAQAGGDKDKLKVD
jgi:uncharacterized phage-like protein YoqJ